MRIYYYKPYRKLISISPDNVDLFHTIIINFIINILSIRDLYISKIYNTILVLIDKLTKYIIYVITTKNLKINRLINLI